jgi:hypothetical protein
VPVRDAASERRSPRLLVRGKVVRLCQHPNKASKIVISPPYLGSQRKRLEPNCRLKPMGFFLFFVSHPAASARYFRYLSSGIKPERVSLVFHSGRKATVIDSADVLCFQYEERATEDFLSKEL